jgi:ABC-type anion transport system duplicated permease subunit
VRKFLHDHVDPGVFAPDAVGTLIAAFDGAWQSIIPSARLSAQQRELTRELLAKYIIAQARQGELDQCRLRDGALLHLARSNLRRPPREQK